MKVTRRYYYFFTLSVSEMTDTVYRTSKHNAQRHLPSTSARPVRSFVTYLTVRIVCLHYFGAKFDLFMCMFSVDFL